MPNGRAASRIAARVHDLEVGDDGVADAQNLARSRAGGPVIGADDGTLNRTFIPTSRPTHIFS